MKIISQIIVVVSIVQLSWCHVSFLEEEDKEDGHPQNQMFDSSMCDYCQFVTAAVSASLPSIFKPRSKFKAIYRGKKEWACGVYEYFGCFIFVCIFKEQKTQGS